jgi:hypothetical protein
VKGCNGKRRHAGLYYRFVSFFGGQRTPRPIRAALVNSLTGEATLAIWMKFL